MGVGDGGGAGETAAGGGAGVGTGGAGGNAVTAHPAMAEAVIAAVTRPRTVRLLQSTLTARCPAMWLILLEAAIALGLLVLIVWWTMFQRPRRKPPEDR